MRYWPLSVIRTSPLLPGDCAAELDTLYSTSRTTVRTFQACGFVVQHTPHVEAPMVAMEGKNVLPKLVYTSMPTAEQWSCLERANVIQGPESAQHFLFLMEMLH